MHCKQQYRWIIAAILFGGFLLAMWLDLTGVSAHQWLGVGVGALACYHLAAHARWVVAVTGRFFGRTSRQARIFYAVDVALAVGFFTILMSGVAVSTWLDLGLAGYATWRSIHVLASVLTLALVVAKIGLHWRWLVSVARRSIFAGLGTPALPDSTHHVPAAVPVGRRDFLKLMSGVGALALLAGVQALGGADDAQTSPAAQTASGKNTLVRATPAASSGSCVVRCRKGCSYPGHCRRYADTNGNGRCDLGECLT